ncbi:hypothetical protein E8P82_13025 [Arthrobacter echini]|uniref:Flagellar assembly protein FliH/Type III secretion system HrpE domain-containing protein n=1 Tax=Arthrobacter echini TaxID=1529066 RepID=A0A4S5E150_9MICC|nr:FliH/SctL family protein [Arthrobacter echini]THJ65047.1 hypothetical protein E8P82_13025 [Arthrobacter echini]
MSTESLLPISFPLLGAGSDTAARDTAAARGHAAGYADGLALARAELAEQRTRLDAERAAERRHADQRAAQRMRVLDAAVRALERQSAPVLAEARTRILDAALEIAEALLGQELQDGPSSARAAVARALSGIDGEDVRTVRLHPADLADLSATDVPAGLQLSPDPSLQRGDAVAECENGQLDARLGSALARVRDVLTGGAPE